MTDVLNEIKPHGTTTIRQVDPLEDFFENGAVGLHLVGPDGTILKANRAELELLGYAQDEYIGRNIREFHADQETISKILVCLGQGEKLDKHPARLKAKDGSIKHVLITSSVLFEGGKFIHTRCFTIDVTEQRQAEEKARQDRELLKSIVETTPECVKIVDREGRIVYMNAAGLRLVEAATAGDALGRSVLELIAPEDREFWQKSHDRVCRGEKLSWEFGIVALHGTRHQMETHAAPITMPDGTLAQLAVTRDVTERQRQQQHLKDNERHLRELLEALPAAVYTTDAEGHIDFYNQAAVELAGRRPALGEQWCVTWKLYSPDGTPMPHAECPMAITLKEGRSVRGVEAVAERPDGTRVPFIPYPTPLRDSSGRVNGAINMLVDISERRQAESQQRLLLDELNHRTKNNMQMLQSLLFTAAKKTRSDEARQVLREASGRIAAMAAAQRVLYGTTDASHFGANEFLGAVCQTVQQTLPREVKIIARTTDVVLSNDAAMPLALILNELLTNAVKHGIRDEVNEAVRVGLTENDRQIELYVEDDGAGFDLDVVRNS